MTRCARTRASPGDRPPTTSELRNALYVFHVPTMEGRTWDNDGRVEDSATGSAAGPTGAFLVHYGKAPAGQAILLHQGSFVGRPSHLTVHITGSAPAMTSVQVSGDVAMVASGTIDVIGM